MDPSWNTNRHAGDVLPLSPCCTERLQDLSRAETDNRSLVLCWTIDRTAQKSSAGRGNERTGGRAGACATAGCGCFCCILIHSNALLISIPLTFRERVNILSAIKMLALFMLVFVYLFVYDTHSFFRVVLNINLSEMESHRDLKDFVYF